VATQNKIEIILSAVDTGLTAAFAKANLAIKAAEAGAGSYGKAVSALQAPINALAGTLAQLGVAFGAVFATKQYLQVADAYSGIDARLKLVTSSSQEFATAQADLYELSQKTGTGYKENAQTYVKLSTALKSSGASGKELISINEAVAKSLVVNGSSAAETSSFLLQFGQAMGSGVLSGDELRATLESNSYFAVQLAKALDTDIAGLRDLGKAQELTTAKIREAIPKMLQQINEDFEKMPLTIGRAMTMLENAFGKLVNGSNQAGGATGKIAEEMRQFVVYLESNGAKIEAFVVRIIEMATSFVKVAWEYRSFIAGFAATTIAVSAIGTLVTAIKYLQSAITSLGGAGFIAKAVAPAGAFFAGWEIGTFLSKFDIVQKAGIAMASGLTKAWLNAKLVWTNFIGGDTSELRQQIAEADRIYGDMFTSVGQEAKTAAEVQKKAINDVTVATQSGAKKQLQATGDALKEMQKAYQNYASEVKRLQAEILGTEISLDQQLRDMARTGMSDANAWNDKKKQAKEYETVAKAAGEAGRLALQSGNPDRTSAAAENFKTQAEYAKMAREQYAGMAEQVVAGDKVIVSQEEALKLKMAGVKAAGEQNIAGLAGMQEAANAAMNVLTEKSGFVDLSKGMDDAEKKWLKNWQRMQAGAIKDIEAVEDRLLAIKDKEITVWINEKVKKATGGLIGTFQRFARGGPLGGYGGGDRISALLEAGEYVVRKEAVARFGVGLFNQLNSLQLPSPAGFANGGMAGASATAAAPTYNLTLNYSGSASRSEATNLAKTVINQLERMHRGRS
jgi:tape measure domain-containing protein